MSPVASAYPESPLFSLFHAKLAQGMPVGPQNHACFVEIQCIYPVFSLHFTPFFVCCRAGMAASAGRGKPVPRAHVDYTLPSGPGRLKELLPEEAESLQKTPYAVIQVQSHGLSVKESIQSCHVCIAI